MPVAEVCRKMGISEATFYNWKKKVFRTWNCRAQTTAATRRRERQAQADRRRSDFGQADAAGRVQKKALRAQQRRQLCQKADRRISGFDQTRCRGLSTGALCLFITNRTGATIEPSATNQRDRRDSRALRHGADSCSACDAKAGRTITNECGESIAKKD